MRSVLVVDDVYTVRMKTELIIRNTGSFSVRSVGSGAEALAAAGSNPPDVIVMDIVMVGMDGIATLQALRERGITCPVIAYTARQERHPGEFTALGFDGFISKAENIQALVSLLRMLLNRQARRHVTPRERSVGSA
jgi:CheY-like chemotaxis protein